MISSLHPALIMSLLLTNKTMCKFQVHHDEGTICPSLHTCCTHPLCTADLVNTMATNQFKKPCPACTAIRLKMLKLVISN